MNLIVYFIIIHFVLFYNKFKKHINQYGECFIYRDSI